MSMADKMSKSIGRSMNTAAGVFAGGAALKLTSSLTSGISDMVTGGMKQADQMADLAATTGMAADEALRYDFALKNGLSSKNAEKLISSASKNIGSVAEVFREVPIPQLHSHFVTRCHFR